MSAVWWVVGGVLILGGVAILAVRGGGVLANRQTERVERLVPDHDLVTDGELVDLEACGCVDCEHELEQLRYAGRELAGEIAGWLRDRTEGITPPVVPGPDGDDR